jgi:hypothetical protein
MSRMVELYLHPPTCLHGVVLNELGTGANLLLPASDIGMDACYPESGIHSFPQSIEKNVRMMP